MEHQERLIVAVHAGIRELDRQRRQITLNIISRFNEAHPVGSTVTFKKWRAVIKAEIIIVALGSERVKVRARNGKEYWLDFNWILDCPQEE